MKRSVLAAIAIVSLYHSTAYISYAQDAPSAQALYREMTKSLNPADTQQQLQMGLWCLERSLISEGFEHLDLALQNRSHIASLNKAFEQGQRRGWFADVAQALAAAGSESSACRAWLEAGISASPSRALLASMALENASPSVRLEACRRALASPRSSLRQHTVKKLGSWMNEEAVAALVFGQALCDAETSVRETAAAVLKESKAKEASEAMLPFLHHGKSFARIHAAEALGNLGEMQAIPSLIAAWSANLADAAPGDGATTASGYAFFGTQKAYVRDFDVQIAQAAVIAKPVIGILQSGSVLDARVLGVSQEIVLSYERRALHQALVKLVGKDLGPDPENWQRWQQNQAGEKTGA